MASLHLTDFMFRRILKNQTKKINRERDELCALTTVTAILGQDVVNLANSVQWSQYPLLA